MYFAYCLKLKCTNSQLLLVGPMSDDLSREITVSQLIPSSDDHSQAVQGDVGEWSMNDVSNDRGAYCFCPVCLFVCLSVCLFVCLSVVNFNLRYNFLTTRDRDFIFGMHTPVMKPFKLTPKINDLVTLTLTLKLKIAFWTLMPPGAYCSVSQTALIFVAGFIF